MTIIKPLALHEITVRFGGLPILERFSLSVDSGRFLCIMGASGSGKTTLLRVMMGLLPPDEGTITGFGDRKKSAVFQENRLCENLSVRANLRLVCPDATEKRLEELLGSLGLAGTLRRPVRLLSGGMQRRVALARALLADYDLLFLDEPFTGLDDATRDTAIALVKRESIGKNVFLVTHSEEMAALLADQTITLS